MTKHTLKNLSLTELRELLAQVRTEIQTRKQEGPQQAIGVAVLRSTGRIIRA